MGIFKDPDEFKAHRKNIPHDILLMNSFFSHSFFPIVFLSFFVRTIQDVPVRLF